MHNLLAQNSYLRENNRNQKSELRGRYSVLAFPATWQQRLAHCSPSSHSSFHCNYMADKLVISFDI